MHLIGLSGRAGCGKDTVADYLHEQHGFARVAFAAPIYRALAAMLQVPEATLRFRAFKERELAGVGRSPREMVQTLGTEWGRNMMRQDFWLLLALPEIEALRRSGVPGVVASDVRFENEAEFLRAQGGQIWHIWRLGVKPVREHVSEAGLIPADADRGIVNDGTIEAMFQRVDKLVEVLEVRARRTAETASGGA